MKSELRAHVQSYSSASSEIPNALASEEKEGRIFETSTEDAILDTSKNSPIPSKHTKYERVLFPNMPNAERSELDSLGSLWTSALTDKPELLARNDNNCKTSCALNSFVDANVDSGNHNTNLHLPLPRKMIPRNMTFGSLNFSTVLTQSSNSSSFQTIPSCTMKSVAASPYVLNIFKKNESKDSKFSTTKAVGAVPAKASESGNPILAKPSTELPRSIAHSPSEPLPSTPCISKKPMVQNNRFGVYQVGGAENGEKGVAGLSCLPGRERPPSQTDSMTTVSLTVSEATTCENGSPDATHGVPAAKVEPETDADESSSLYSRRQRMRAPIVSFMVDKIDDTVRPKILHTLSLQSFIKDDQQHQKCSHESDVSIGERSASCVKGMISFRSRGSTYSGYNLESNAGNVSYSYGCVSASNDETQFSGVRSIPPYNRPSINITHVSSLSSATPCDLSEGSDDNSIASAPDPLDMCMTNTLRKWKTKAGYRFVNQYQVLGDIGHGTCARVLLAYDTVHSRLVALKEVHRADAKKRLGGPTQAQLNHESFMREVFIMKRLRHKNIVHLYEVIDDPNAEELYLVMQYVDRGVVAVIKVNNNTNEVCEPIPPLQLVQIARQALAGLEYLHRHNVVHRDIKPQNILMDSNGVLYLSDFGLAEIFDKQYLHRMHRMMEQSMAISKDLTTTEANACVQKILGVKGTVLFIAPEVWEGSSTNGKPVDIWAMGVTLFTLLTGRLPFTTVVAVKDPTQPVIPTEYGAEWAELLKGMLMRNPKKRMTVSQARLQVKKLNKLYDQGDSCKVKPDATPKQQVLDTQEGAKNESANEDVNESTRLNSFLLVSKFAALRPPVEQEPKSACLAPHQPPLGVPLHIGRSLSTSPSGGSPSSKQCTVIRRCCQRHRWMSLCSAKSNSPELPCDSLNRPFAQTVELKDPVWSQPNPLSTIGHDIESSSNISSENFGNNPIEAVPRSIKQAHPPSRTCTPLNLSHVQNSTSSVAKFIANTHPGHLPSNLSVSVLKKPQTHSNTLPYWSPYPLQPAWESDPVQLPPIPTQPSTAQKKIFSSDNSLSSNFGHYANPLKKDNTGEY